MCTLYGLNEGPQTKDFGSELLLRHCVELEITEVKDYNATLKDIGFEGEGDRQLTEAILKFTRMLLEHCGNRSIYASSSLLNDLLNSTSLSILVHTLEVGSELAQRYQASVKRIGSASRQISSALLANHYNIDLGRVFQLSLPFAKTPLVSLGDNIPSSTPSSSAKGKEKALAASTKHATATHASDLIAVATSENQYWSGWGDVKVLYYPDGQDSSVQEGHVGNPSQPSTPTPIRRTSSALNPQNSTPRARQLNFDDASPITPRAMNFGEDNASSGQKSFDLPESILISKPIPSLMKKCPADMPAAAKYEVFHRLRVAKALKESREARQTLLAVRLLAATNLAYVYSESVFIEKVLRQDIDETRRYQLISQLANLIHPSDSDAEVPMQLQTIALALLEAISSFPNKVHEVLLAVNANVNHGILLYVIRKAVSSMKVDHAEDQGDHITMADEWRNNLFSLTLHLSMAPRVGNEMVSAGLMEILVDMLKVRTIVGQRHHSMVIAFLDSLIWTYQNAFTAFFNADGLDTVATLAVDTVKEAQELLKAGHGIGKDYQSGSVDYEIPFYQQQTLKWLAKFIHHVMSNSYSYGGNTDRLLRNLAEKSDLLQSLREIIQDKRTFGSIIWTSTVTILADFINNDPTSFAAISESGMIRTYLEAITCRPLPEEQAPESMDRDQEGDTSETPDNVLNASLGQDDRPHPPSDESMIELARDQFAAGILPSADAISVVPMVLNSISLNNAGMKMVVASRALESFLEIFESPEHVKLMAADDHLTASIGSGFDELARHHPALRTTISNAVVDMIARVRFLGREKARNADWGSGLLITDMDKKIMTVTNEEGFDDVTEKMEKLEKDAHSLNDVDMPDVARPNQTAQEIADVSPWEPFLPYLTALGNFLGSYTANSILKTSLIDAGGIEMLLDLCESPSLPASFSESVEARPITVAVNQLIEMSPVRGMPSLFHRTLQAVEALQPLFDRSESQPAFFAPFLQPNLDLSALEPEEVETVRKGTKYVRALLNVQTFLKILSHCFLVSRSQSAQLYPVNVFDYYLRLVQRLAPLLRGVLAEEETELTMVPDAWVKRHLNPGTAHRESDLPPRNGESTNILPSGATWEAPGENKATNWRPTPSELYSSQFQNFEVLRQLLHPLFPTSFPFHQSLGKALIPRRDNNPNNPYPRPRQLEIAQALASNILDQLRPKVEKAELGSKDYQYWIITLHSVHELLIDRPTSRQGDRSPVQITIPVLLAFKEQKGFEVLDKMVAALISTVCEEGAKTLSEQSSKGRVAAFALKKMLDLYAVLSNGKHVADSCAHYTLQRSVDRSQSSSSILQQLVLEIHAAIAPSLKRVWDTKVIESISKTTVRQLINILKLIGTSDGELQTIAKDKPPFSLFKYTDVRFNWKDVEALVDDLTKAGYDIDLAKEAAYRSNGNNIMAREYCRAHTAGLAGPRNPVPSIDEKAPQQDESNETLEETPVLDTDAMAVDPVAETSDDIIRPLQTVPWYLTGSDNSATSSTEPVASGEIAKPPASSAELLQVTAAKDELDQFRKDLRANLLAQSLDVIRFHPDVAIEVSDLIKIVALRSGSLDNQDDVPSTLTLALSSLLMNEEEQQENGKPIAAYAHLLALVLQDGKLFERNVEILREKVGEYIELLKISPSLPNDNLPPWIPFILLLLEMFLCYDERPVPAQWKQPKSLDDKCGPPILETREKIVNSEQRHRVVELVIDLLPRIGKEEVLATSVLRVLVIVSRQHEVAKSIGEKKNLQRLFLMVRQLSGSGSERLKQTKIASHITTILRHIIEDDEIIRQVMRTEIKSGFPQALRQRGNNVDVPTYLRTMSSLALRSPDIFVEVTNELVHFQRWLPSNGESARAQTLAIKHPLPGEPLANVSGNSTKPDSQNVKETTELGDSEMADATKEQGDPKKAPVVENPDGVVHFLLCELLNFRDVDDKEAQMSTDSSAEKEPVSSATNNPSNPPKEDAPDSKEKKQSKPVFKAEEHPIFIYRCFLLNTLTELLKSYTRAKVEFINFKRSAASLSSTTPVKPRSSVLNYLLDNLLCQGNLTGNADTILAKKKAATSTHVQKLFTALVTKTSEASVDRSQDKYEYDSDLDLLFVRKFVLDTLLKAYERIPNLDEPMELRYSRMQSLAELMIHMAASPDKDGLSTARGLDSDQIRSQAQLRRLMYEKGYLDRLTSSIADISLNYPNVKRAIKYILRVVRLLTDTVKDLSHSNILPTDLSGENFEDDIDSSSSLSDIDDDREETPDLYRNSALGMLEPRGEDDESQDEEEAEDDDEDMYGDEYEDEEMDYGNDDISDGEDDISDEDEEGLSEMGGIEGLHGDPGMVEVIMDGDDDDDDDEEEDDDEDEDDEDEDSEEDDDEDDDVDSADLEDMDDQIQIVDELGNPIDDDGASGWESDSEANNGVEAEVDDEFEVQVQQDGDHLEPVQVLDNLARAIIGEDQDYDAHDIALDDHDHLLDMNDDEGKQFNSLSQV